MPEIGRDELTLLRNIINMAGVSLTTSIISVEAGDYGSCVEIDRGFLLKIADELERLKEKENAWRQELIAAREARDRADADLDTCTQALKESMAECDLLRQTSLAFQTRLTCM